MPQYGRHDWLKDLPAGLTVGVMLVPQGMAYAMIAGLPVVYGLYAALIPQVIYALMGTSRQLAVGPAAMDSLLVAAGLGAVAVAGSDRYIELALLLALMMGGLQLLLGTFRLGFLAHFISKPVISGFTSAAALIIGLNQLPHLTGIALPRSSQLHRLMGGTFDGLAQFHAPTLLLGVASIALLIGLRKRFPRVPGSLVLVALTLAGGAVWPWGTWNIRTVGAIPAGLPGFHVPEWTLDDLHMLFPLAATLALVAFMEAYSVAQTMAQKRGDHEIDADQELRALGSANAIGSLFGAYPVTGGFSRTAVNERAGAISSMSSLIAAGVVALALTFLTPVFQHLPTAVLGAIIAVAVAGLFDLATFRRMWMTHRDEAALLLLTFGLTAFGGMVLGIASGVVLGLALTLFRTTRPHTAELGEINGVYRNLNRFPDATKAPGTLLVRYDGPLNYASQGHFKGFILSRLAIRKEEGDPIRTVVLSAESIPYLDATGTDMLTALLDALEVDGISLKVAGAIGPVRDVLERAGLMERIGRNHFHTGIPAALGIEEIRPRIATQTINPNNS